MVYFILFIILLHGKLSDIISVPYFSGDALVKTPTEEASHSITQLNNSARSLKEPMM